MKKIIVFYFLIIYCNFLFANQQYEKLSLSTQSLLNSKISDSTIGNISINSFSTKQEEENWIDEKDIILKKYIQNDDYRRIFLKTVHYEATRAALEPELVLSVIHVESSFKKYAISNVGALGYMQVMPFWLDLLSKNKNHNLFDLSTNLRYGCTILRHYIEIEKGNVSRALARYNGSLGKEIYPNKVFEKKQKWI